MEGRAIQDYYPDNEAICYGCGRHNPHGLNIRTHWDGRQGILRFTPAAYHAAFPGVVYGGLIASLIDCHAIGTAIAAAYDLESREPGTPPPIYFVTGNLNIRFLKPTPMGRELLLQAQVKTAHEKKSVITCTVAAGKDICATAEVVAVRVPAWTGL